MDRFLYMEAKVAEMIRGNARFIIRTVRYFMGRGKTNRALIGGFDMRLDKNF